MSFDYYDYSSYDNSTMFQTMFGSSWAAEYDDDEELRYEMSIEPVLLKIVVPVIFSLIAVLGFVGNLSVIVVVVSNLQMRSTTNTLIISLAIADLLFIVTCVPFTAISYAIPKWPFGTVWCKVFTQ